MPILHIPVLRTVPAGRTIMCVERSLEDKEGGMVGCARGTADGDSIGKYAAFDAPR